MIPLISSLVFLDFFVRGIVFHFRHGQALHGIFLFRVRNSFVLLSIRRAEHESKTLAYTYRIVRHLEIVR